MAQDTRLDPREKPDWNRDTAGKTNEVIRAFTNTNDNITAGTVQTQTGATGLQVGFNRVTTATANDGVRLPISVGGSPIWLRNDSGQTIDVYPPKGGSINGGSTNAAVNLASGSTVTYVSFGLDYYT